MITWPAFIGCTSGMNDAGLTVTINSDESSMPSSSATPISLVAREILQYATNIQEAYAIAARRKIFVSESFLIGSAKDHRAVIIEKTPDRLALYDPGQDQVLSTNHYLSDSFRNDEVNVRCARTTSSGYRYEHLAELMDAERSMDPVACARILRDQRGKGGKDIGMCNEKAVNQMIAHHSVIFQPERRRFWISTQPFMLGRYICYDLDSVFAEAGHFTHSHEIYNKAQTIAPDTFLNTTGWSNFCIYKKHEESIIKSLNDKSKTEPAHDWDTMIRSNPEYWYPYYLVGRYYQDRQMDDKALKYYHQALSKEINDSIDIYQIKALIQKMGTKNQ
jgi:tetratricopeptide (TPR) repeat protein